MTLSPNNSQDRLLDFITQIEQALGERALITERIAEIYDVAESDGFDKKAIREVIRVKKLGVMAQEFEKIRELYLSIAGI